MSDLLKQVPKHTAKKILRDARHLLPTYPTSRYNSSDYSTPTAENLRGSLFPEPLSPRAPVVNKPVALGLSLRTWIIIGIIAFAVAAIGAFLVWYYFIREKPAPKRRRRRPDPEPTPEQPTKIEEPESEDEDEDEPEGEDEPESEDEPEPEGEDEPESEEEEEEEPEVAPVALAKEGDDVEQLSQEVKDLMSHLLDE